VVTTLESSASAGDLNSTLNLDCPTHAGVVDGKPEGVVRVFSTGDRKSNSPWQVNIN